MKHLRDESGAGDDTRPVADQTLEKRSPGRVDVGQATEVEADAVRWYLGRAAGRLQLADPGPQELAFKLEHAGQIVPIRSRDYYYKFFFYIKFIDPYAASR